MHDISREILESYQVRKTKEQKSRFIAFLQTRYPELRVEEGKPGTLVPSFFFFLF